LTAISCQTQKTPISNPENTYETVNEDEESGQPIMSVDKNYLSPNQRKISIKLKIAEKNQLINLENYNLKVTLIEEPLEKDEKPSYITYINAAGEKHSVTVIDKPLTEFTTDVGIGASFRKKQLKIDINLQPNEQAARIKLEVELLNRETNNIQKQEIVWRKQKLLVRNLNELLGETKGSFSLKNLTDSPLDPSKVELAISAKNGLICQFTKTNSSKAILDQLWTNNTQTFGADAETAPIELELYNVSKAKNTEKIMLIITQDEERTNLATHTINFKIPHQTSVFKTNSSQEQASAGTTDQENRQKKKKDGKNKQNNTNSSKKPIYQPHPNENISNKEQRKQQEEHQREEENDNQKPSMSPSLTPTVRTTHPHEKSIKQEDTPINKEFNQEDKRINMDNPIKKEKKKTQEKTKKNATSKKKSITIPKIELRLRSRTNETKKKLKFTVKNQGKELSKEAFNNVKLRYEILEGTGNLSNVKLKRGNRTDVNGVGMGELLNSDFAVGQEKDFELILENSDNADALTINIFLEGIENSQMVMVNWRKEEKISEKRNKSLNSPNLQLLLKERTDKTKKKLKFTIKNQGEELNKEAFNNVKLRYEILEGTGNLSNVKLKRGNRTDINGIGMGDLLNSNLVIGQEKDFELILENENADSLTIKLFLEGAKNKKPVTIKWKKTLSTCHNKK
jgi:hypothetical protein